MTRTLNHTTSTFLALLASAAMLAALFWQAPFTLSAAHAQTAFNKELRAQNAHHFTKPPVLKKGAKPLSLEKGWEKKPTRKIWKLNKWPISVEVTLKTGGPPDRSLLVGPVLKLSVEGKHILSVEGVESVPDNPIFLIQIAEMDPGNPHPEVIFSTFTGGAHCCSDTRVLISSKDGKTWRELQIGEFDGEPLGVSDVDGDGRYEFVMRDNAFLYTFGCYACSTAPLRVLALEGGKIVNISGKTSLRAQHVESLRNMIDWAEGDVDMNGFLAGYVAQKILLGEGAGAWKLMMKYYDRKSDWGLKACSVKLDDKGECPGKKEMLSYPRALEIFLKDAGYELKK